MNGAVAAAVVAAARGARRGERGEAAGVGGGDGAAPRRRAPEEPGLERLVRDDMLVGGDHNFITHFVVGFMRCLC